LAAALGVSVRTVDRMVAAGEIVPVRMRGWSVRFYVPDVVEALRNERRKWGRAAAVGGNPKAEIRNPKEIRSPKSINGNLGGALE
jgi:excisionase family DNA binding protein